MKTIVNTKKRNFHLPIIPLVKPAVLSWKTSILLSALVTSAIYLSSCKAQTQTFTSIGGIRVQVSPNRPIKEPLGVLIDRVATEVGLHPSLAFALISEESNFNPNALSSTNAVGLTQVLRSTAKSECGIKELKHLADEEINIRCGLSYLKKLRNKYGTLEKALISYNAGAGNMLNPKRDPKKYQDAVKYTKRIMTKFMNSIS